MEADAIYFRRRAREEHEAAAKAKHEHAREAHLQLAARYEDLAGAIETREQYLGLREERI